MTLSYLSRDCFSSVRTSIARRCGLVIGESQDYLIKQRLQALMHEYGLVDWCDLAQRIAQQPNSPLTVAVIDKITTHETSFFRDQHPWRMIDEVALPALATRPRLVCSSLAASTGQEAYSLAMTIAEHQRRTGRQIDYRIEASDISDEVLQRGKQGWYHQREVDRGLDEPVRSRYASPDGDGWQIDDELRQGIDWRAINLYDADCQIPESDLMLCRNVLIYFESTLQQHLFERFVAALRPGGYLFLGAAETFAAGDLPVTRVRHGSTLCYQKKDSA